MELTVTGTLDRVNFSPGNAVEEIVQNVKTLLATRRFSVPLDRALGLDMRVLDAPMPRAQAGYRVEIIEALRRFEPRCKVLRVDFSGDGIGGALMPKVKVRIDGEAI